MQAKQLLLKNEKLHAWWSAIVGDGRFDQVMLILKAATFEGQPSPEQMSGVTQFMASMEDIVEADLPPTVYAKPGLNHNLDVPHRTVEPPEVPQQPKTPKKKKSP